MANEKKPIKDYSPEEIGKALERLKGKPLPSDTDKIHVLRDPDRFKERS